MRCKGLDFEPGADGGVTVQVFHNETDNGQLSRTFHYTAEEWAAIITAVPSNLKLGETEPVDVSGTVADVTELINAQVEDAALDAIAEAERNGKNRNGVFDAIEHRRAELAV